MTMPLLPSDRLRFAFDIPAPGGGGVIVRTDDPTYMPASSAQVAELADLVQEVRDEIHSAKTRSIFSISEFGASATGLESQGAKTRFERFAAKWRSETELCSTVLEMATNSSYQHIIGMGRVAVPFLLAELAQRPDHWFWALKAITGEDPVSESDRGDLRRMTQAWLIWGARNGYEF
jgi:hypothetical protein